MINKDKQSFFPNEIYVLTLSFIIYFNFSSLITWYDKMWRNGTLVAKSKK